MISLKEFIKEFSEEYSVKKFEDIDGRIFKAKIKGDIYLISNAEVKES